MPSPNITIYGHSHGRTSRCLLALEELGLPYRRVALRPWAIAADKQALRDINPNERVPVLEDDGLIIWESMAINLYLGDQYGFAPLWPRDPRDRALIYQWSVWGQTEIDVMARHKDRYSGEPDRVARAKAELDARLAILDDALYGRDFLVGKSFTFADINVLTTLKEPWELSKPDAEVRVDDPRFPALGAWLERCMARRTWERVGEFAD